MEKLTAYNKDIQKYVQGNGCSTKQKNEIIEQIENNLVGMSFEKLFPTRSKRKEVMDHIIYLLSGNGICKIAAPTLAEKVKCSIRTVTDAVKNLKETGAVIVAGLADGKNKYVFVLKTHANFKAIMEDVFYLNAEQIAEQTAEQIAEQENAEPVEAVSTEGEKTSSNYNNSFNSINSFNNLLKQEKENIKESIENELESVSSVTITEEEVKRVNTFYTNDYQHNLYHSIKGGQYTPDMKLCASVIGLRVGSNCTSEYYNCALKAAYKLNRFIMNGGTVEKSIPAMFTNIFADEIKSFEYQAKQQEEKKRAAAPAFYNWLEA